MRILMTLLSFVFGGGGIALVALFITTVFERQSVPRYELLTGALLVVIGWLIYQGSGKIPGE